VHLQSLHTTTGWRSASGRTRCWMTSRDLWTPLWPVKATTSTTIRRFPTANATTPTPHLKGSLFGQTLLVQVRNAALLLGTWQSLILAEFDGPRSRSIAVQIQRHFEKNSSPSPRNDHPHGPVLHLEQASRLLPRWGGCSKPRAGARAVWEVETALSELKKRIERRWAE